jgi:hypothetical protein
MTDRCPFQAGDKVRYQPTERGYALDVMSDRLTPGETYIVEAVEGGKYVVVCGYTHPGGGIYWTEFKEA